MKETARAERLIEKEIEKLVIEEKKVRKRLMDYTILLK